MDETFSGRFCVYCASGPEDTRKILAGIVADERAERSAKHDTRMCVLMCL
jgi:hypothetical protein